MNWFLTLLLPNGAEAVSKIIIVCTNLYYDVEDEYKTVFISDRYPGRPNRKYATYHDDFAKKIKKMRKKQRNMYFISFALWCSNKIRPEYTIYEINDKVLEKLIFEYYSIMRVGNLFDIINQIDQRRMIARIQKSISQTNSTLLNATTTDQ